MLTKERCDELETKLAIHGLNWELMAAKSGGHRVWDEDAGAFTDARLSANPLAEAYLQGALDACEALNERAEEEEKAAIAHTFDDVGEKV